MRKNLHCIQEVYYVVHLTRILPETRERQQSKTMVLVQTLRFQQYLNHLDEHINSVLSVSIITSRNQYKSQSFRTKKYFCIRWNPTVKWVIDFVLFLL